MEQQANFPEGAVQRAVERKGRRAHGAAGPSPAEDLEAHDAKRQHLAALQRQQQLTHLARVAMLGGLSGAIAHEINQPLTAILSNANAAQRFIDQGTIDVAELRETLQVGAGARYWAEAPDGGPSGWGWRLSVKLLFPK